VANRPTEIHANLWTGEASPTGRPVEGTCWEMPRQINILDGRNADARFAPEPLADLRDWRNPNVGWGLVLPERTDLNAKDKAKAADAPEPIRKLVQFRGDAPVLRWKADLRPGELIRYYPGGESHPRSTSAAEFGTGVGKLPRYLLIYATPTEIPWMVQYQLNLTNFVGRLALAGDALENYISCLLSNWEGDASASSRPVVWSVNDGAEDITGLMASALGKQLVDEFSGDPDLQARTWITGRHATRGNLARVLAERTPGLICTTSHGMTPTGDVGCLREQLGAPVDARKSPFTLTDLGEWSPAGAIWYAHACCSAGADAQTRYEGLFSEEDPLGATLRDVASASGACIAPLPQHLLGCPRPLRAFVGHVEPTFDWTLRDPISKQVLTHTLVQCLYKRLYQADRPSPIAWALQDNYLESARFYGVYRTAKAKAGLGDLSQVDQLYQQLAAMDRQTMVILGDPTVTLPGWPPSRQHQGI
jgi:hypothetical protein